MKLQEWVQLEKRTGGPVQVGELSLRPEVQVFRLRFPWGGYVLNRPTGMLVDDGKQVERVAITDVTRIAQTALLVTAGFFILLRWLASAGETA